jgi:hypothetical protein
MTHAEQILRAVAVLVAQDGKETFTRDDVRRQIGLPYFEWMAKYTSIFQAMRVDCPGGAPNIGDRYRNMLKRVERGKYVLTTRGCDWIRANS